MTHTHTPNLHSRIGNCTCGAALYRLLTPFGVRCRHCGETVFGLADVAQVFADPRLRAAIVAQVLRDYDQAGARNPVTGRGDLDSVWIKTLATVNSPVHTVFMHTRSTPKDAPSGSYIHDVERANHLIAWDHFLMAPPKSLFFFLYSGALYLDPTDTPVRAGV